MRIALVEDDIDQVRLIKMWLENAGHHCDHFEDGGGFVKSASRDSFDCVILDWMLPGQSGLDVLVWMRENLSWAVPVIFVTAKEEERDIVAALESGADDYMIKPIRELELMARLNAVRRRTKTETLSEDNVLTLEPYTIDKVNRSVALDSETVQLTRKEYELVVFFFANLGRILSRSHILTSVWGTSPDLNTRTVDTHVSRIRRKLDLNPKRGWRLASIYQHGYRLEQLRAGSEGNS